MIRKQVLCFTGLFLIAPLIHALPFDITPTQDLPKEIVTEGSEAAYYTIKNNTNRTLTDNYIKYLPPNVTQITDYTGYCGETFDLTPSGTPGDSCTLYLVVDGPVDSSDPNPHHHLFACSGGYSCAGTNYPLNVQTINQPPLLTVGGGYTLKTSQNEFFPLVAQSNDGGVEWNYIIDANYPKLPDNFNRLYVLSLTQVSNKGPVGVVSTIYYDFNSKAYPLLGVTTNGGKTWEYKNLQSSTKALPSDFEHGALYDVSCGNTKICATAGGYTNNINISKIKPLVLISQNGANTWHYQEIQNMPALYRSVSINSVSCNASGYCMVAGYYADEMNYPKPFLAVSNKNAEAWSFKTLTPPSDLGSGNFTSADCNDQGVCIASGSYVTTTPAQFPLAALSQDNGKTWRYIYDSQNTPPSSPSSQFYSACCDGNLCTAVGSETVTSSYTSYPFVVTSTNYGVTWNTIIDSTSTNLPTDFSNSGVLNSVSCSNNTVVAGGSYSYNNGSNSVYYPLLVSTNNRWNTFFYDIDAAARTLPYGFSGCSTSANSCGNFASVSINNSLNLAVGSYNTNNGTYPMLATKNNYSIWSYKIDGKGPTFPDNFSTGQFSSVSVNMLTASNSPSKQLSPDFPLLSMNSNISSAK